MEEHVGEIISELIAIEEQCAQVTTPAQGELAQLDERVEEERRKINAAMDERIAEELEIIQTAAVEATRQKLEEAHTASQRMFAAIESAYEAHGGEWRDMVFRDIIGEGAEGAVDGL